MLTYTAHSSAVGIIFYNGTQFPVEYRGCWNRQPPSGYKVVRLRFQNGQPVAFEDFITGWLREGNEPAYSARPTGIAVTRDGSLLISDDTNGVIYRVSYSAQ